MGDLLKSVWILDSNCNAHSGLASMSLLALTSMSALVKLHHSLSKQNDALNLTASTASLHTWAFFSDVGEILQVRYGSLH
jgi:hypothetical protein